MRVQDDEAQDALPHTPSIPYPNMAPRVPNPIQKCFGMIRGRCSRIMCPYRRFSTFINFWSVKSRVLIWFVLWEKSLVSLVPKVSFPRGTISHKPRLLVPGTTIVTVLVPTTEQLAEGDLASPLARRKLSN